MTTLKSVLLNNPSQICAIIQDDNSVKGTDLFTSLLRHDAENDGIKEIHLIACENPPEYYLQAVSNPKIIAYNLFQDPANWLEKNISQSPRILFDRILKSEGSSSTIMIDSLNFLILLENVNYMCNTIHKLRTQYKKVISLFHTSEIISNDVIKKFEFLSNVCLTLYKNKTKGLNQLTDEKNKSKLVECIHIKPSGKTTAFKEIVLIDEKFHLHSEVYKTIKNNSVCSNVKDNFKNITTFRLGLDIMENEKKARDNLVLPYLRSSNKDDERTGGGEGKIVYYAESEDDLEDDPDDDLDI